MTEQHQARARVRKLKQWLMLDLDGDATLTRAEVARALTRDARSALRSAAGPMIPTNDQIAETLERLIEHRMPKDSDGDGIVTIEEMMALARAEFPATGVIAGGPAPSRLVPAALDVNGDGLVQWKEVAAAVTPVLRRADRDGNGVLSQAELKELSKASRDASRRFAAAERARRQKLEQRTRTNACNLPRARKGTMLVALQIYQGRAVPTVSLGGDDVATNLADFEIAEGDEPLYLVVTTAQPTILRFSGAANRIQRVVAIGPRIGFVGVERKHVMWTEPGVCAAPSWGHTEFSAGSWGKTLSEGAGRAPDRAFFIWHAGRISLPDNKRLASQEFPGAVTHDMDGPAAPLWKAFKVFAPGGLVYLQAGDVVAPGKATRYAIFPHLAGLATMVEDGSLALRDPGAMYRIKTPGRTGCANVGGNKACIGLSEMTFSVGGESYRSGGGGVMVSGRLPTLEILREIRYPAGLIGAQAAKFLRSESIPEPEGNRGNSKIEVTSQQ